MKKFLQRGNKRTNPQAKSGMLIYRCRSCGAEFPAYRIPDAQNQFPTIVHELSAWFGPPIYPLEAHMCSPGVFGAADIIRCEIDTNTEGQDVED